MVSALFKPQTTTALQLPLYLSTIRAGFPSPADDYIETPLDLNEFLIKRPASTFYVRVKGNSMVNAGIFTNDILIVDRAIEPYQNRIVVAILDGEFTVKRFRRVGQNLILIAENPEYSNIHITEEREFEVWGVVVHVIHHV